MKDYDINIGTLAIIPLDEDSTKIIEVDNEFVVKENSMKIIDNSCKYFGSSYNGRLAGTKNMIGVNYKAPIVIEDSKSIIFFPISSPRLNECLWISFKNVESYEKIVEENKTKVKFISGLTLTLPISHFSFSNQLLRSSRLENVLNLRKNRLNYCKKD